MNEDQNEDQNEYSAELVAALREEAKEYTGMWLCSLYHGSEDVWGKLDESEKKRFLDQADGVVDMMRDSISFVRNFDALMIMTEEVEAEA